ncbi:MAG: alpha/beta hydrolase [Actinobacteria bacterium]|nr:alpha/beta hydrolase [Actinomycetota bacterium]
MGQGYPIGAAGAASGRHLRHDHPLGRPPAGPTLAGAVTSWARRFIYYPDDRVPPRHPPAGLGTGVALHTADGLELAAWYLPGRGDTAVLLCNGNAGNRADRLPLSAALQRRNLGVLSLDYRGYGGNPGDPEESGLIADAEAGAVHLSDRPEVTRLVYFGESLGAAVLVGLAERRPPDALVLRSPFTSLLEVARAHLPFVPAGVIDDRWASLERIANIDVPLLVLAGTADRVVPYEQSVRLFEAAPGPKRFVSFEDADHNDAVLAFGARLLDETARFLEDVSGASAGGA